MGKTSKLTRFNKGRRPGNNNKFNSKPTFFKKRFNHKGEERTQAKHVETEEEKIQK